MEPEGKLGVPFFYGFENSHPNSVVRLRECGYDHQ